MPSGGKGVAFKCEALAWYSLQELQKILHKNALIDDRWYVVDFVVVLLLDMTFVDIYVV